MIRCRLTFSLETMSSSRRPWTDEDLEFLKELAERNFSLQVIALKLGRSVAAVDAKASQQKIPMRRMKRAYRKRGATPEQHKSVQPR